MEIKLGEVKKKGELATGNCAVVFFPVGKPIGNYSEEKEPIIIRLKTPSDER